MCWHDRLVVEMEEVGPLRDEDVVINFTLPPRAALPHLQWMALRSPLGDRLVRPVDATWLVRTGCPVRWCGGSLALLQLFMQAGKCMGSAISPSQNDMYRIKSIRTGQRGHEQLH
jgi:hypothetical protein